MRRSKEPANRPAKLLRMEEVQDRALLTSDALKTKIYMKNSTVGINAAIWVGPYA